MRLPCLARHGGYGGGVPDEKQARDFSTGGGDGRQIGDPLDSCSCFGVGDRSPTHCGRRGSAGGHLAAAAGTVAGFNEPGENLSVSCVPAALVLFNPVLDNSPGGFGHEQCKAYWKDISPLYNIHVQTPPTVVFLGTADELVPVTSAQKFQSEMQALGLRCDLFLYKGQPHGFFNKAKYRETMVEADRFLNSLGLLQGSPTL